MSLETDTHKKIFEAWEKESESTLLFLQENGKAITVDGKKIRIDIPSKLLLDLRNGHNIAKLVDWNHEETQSGGYLAAIPCPEYRIDGETYTAIGTVYDHAKLDSMLKLKGYNGNAYLFMLDNEGNITYTNQSEDIFFRNYSLLKHLKKAQAITENEAAFLRKKIEEKEAGVLLLGKASRYYLGYAPIESNNTTLICIVPKGIVDNVLRDYQKTVWFATVLMVSFIFLLWIGLTWSVFKLSIADQKAEYEKRNNELQLQTMKKMEEANKKLKKAKNIATEALQTAENANKAKTDFLSNMSHDIRTPMNAIVGFTDIAMKRKPDKEVENCLKKIRQSSEYLMTLINDVLDISRIESGKLEYKPVPVDLRDMINTVLSIARGYTENRDLNFYVSREELKTPYVMADELRIREVLLNIISNAVKFTKDGGTISFAAENCPGNEEHHMIVRYRISDTGIGMSEEFQARIFDEFSQENGGARTSYKGTGLGMAIAKQYVDLMGGKIEVSSKKGIGSTFTVEIPLLIAEQVQAEEKEKLRKDIDLHGLHVLLAEDNDLNAEIAVSLLEEQGMIITRAADGKSALAQFCNTAPGTFDLILMDIMMPEMNGYETTKAIRNLPDRPDGKEIPIIAMTANAFAEDVQAALNAGMDDHVAKPVDMEIITSVITKYVER